MKERLQLKLDHIAKLLRVERRLLLPLAMLLLGGLVLLLSMALPKAATETPATTVPAAPESVDQARELEERLTALLSAIDGVGRVRVMVTLESGSENYYLYNRNSDESADGARSSAGRKDDYVIVKNGSSEQGVLVKVAEPQVRGVAVVCQGGADPAVRTRVVEAVAALLKVSSARISVAAMQSGAEIAAE